MKKGVISVNSNAEKTIIAMTISVVLAIIFDGKKKKPAKRKSFAQRVSKHYKTIDNIMLMTVAKVLLQAVLMIKTATLQSSLIITKNISLFFSTNG